MFTIAIPTHNEEKRIRATLEKLYAFLEDFGKPFEVLVVDDGKDATLDMLRLYAGHGKHNIRIYHFPHRLGKGGALTQALHLARGDSIITYDADGAVPPKEIPRMLAALKKHDVVIGSRKQENAVIVGNVPLQRRFASKSFNFLVNVLFDLGVRDTQCGFKGFRRKKITPLARSFKRTGFEWDVEVLAKAKRAGLSITEIPVEWHHKKEGKVVLRDVAHMLSGILSLKRELR